MAQSMDKFIIGVVIIGLTLVIGIFIASTIETATSEDASGSSINETLSAVDNITNSTFAIISTYSDASCNLISINNATDGEDISGEGNYTFYPSDCKVIFQDDSPYIGEDVNVTYSYVHIENTATSNASGDLVTSLSGGSAWITILIVVGFATIVLGMLTSGLGRTAEQESAYAY